MKGVPVLASLPQKRRNVLFAPLLLGAFLVLFFALGFLLNDIFVPLLVAVPASVATAWALVGWPRVTMKDGRPLIEPRHKPYLFFPLAPVFAYVAYVVVGAILTRVAFSPKLLAPVSLVAAAVIGCGAAYALVGFPHTILYVRSHYERVPPERRSIVFFPILFVLFFLVLYVGLVAGTTAALTSVLDNGTLLNAQLLLLLPLSLLVAGLAAHLLVGFPRPQKPIRQVLPKVPGRHRRRAFLLTLLLAGAPLTLAVGALLTYLAAARLLPLPEALVLPLALVLGYALALGLSAAVWGTPARWRRYDDYRPGLTPRARLIASAAAAVAVALATVIAFGLAGLDIFWGILLGLLLGASAGILVSGVHRRLAAARAPNALLPPLPDRMKSAFLLGTWLLLALVLASVLTYALPAVPVGWNALVGILVGLVVAFFLTEQPLLRDWLAERRAAREKRKAWARHRKEALARAAADESADAKKA